jgi:hypothetical protein
MARWWRKATSSSTAGLSRRPRSGLSFSIRAASKAPRTGIGAIARATAAVIPGTVVHRIVVGDGVKPETRIGHPSGALTVGAAVILRDGEWTVTKASMSRSARRLMEGGARYRPAVSISRPERYHRRTNASKAFRLMVLPCTPLALTWTAAAVTHRRWMKGALQNGA